MKIPRQQSGKHNLKHKWFIENGWYVNRETLRCGDYQLPGKGDKSVDTKKDIMEIVSDIQVKQMPKKEVKTLVDYIWSQNIIINGSADEVYHLIVDDDSERFAELEISQYCFKNGIPEKALKQFQELYVKRHGFFHRGLVRAKNYGIKLYILVENNDGITDINSLFKWVNPRRKIMVNSKEIIGYWKNGNPRYKKVQKYPNCMMGEQLAKACLTMQSRYGCEFVFCKPEESAEMIIKLLGGDTNGN